MSMYAMQLTYMNPMLVKYNGLTIILLLLFIYLFLFYYFIICKNFGVILWSHLTNRFQRYIGIFDMMLKLNRHINYVPNASIVYSELKC
jgi:hypothetical protein